MGNEWTKKSQKTVFDGYKTVTRKTFTLPNGQTHDFDVFESSLVVAVLAVTADGKILCLKQYRPGPEKLLFELPGGGVEGNEQLHDAMKRELLEETGYSAEFKYIGSYYLEAYSSMQRHMFVGTHAQKVAEPTPEDTEHAELLLLSVDEFKEKLFAGLMTDTTLGYAGLHHLGQL